jgi:chromosome segregation ATPase
VSQTLAKDRDAAWSEARRIAMEWERAVAAANAVQQPGDDKLRNAQVGLEAAMEREREAIKREAAILADRDLWLHESKRLEREWTQQAARVRELSAKVDALFAEVQTTANDRDNWQREAARISREWEIAAEQLHQLRAHNDQLSAYSNVMERERDDAARRVTELVASNEQQTAEIDRLLAQLREASMSVAHHRGLYEAMRSEADALERRRAFRIARAFGFIDPIYTGKTAPTLGTEGVRSSPGSQSQGDNA